MKKVFAALIFFLATSFIPVEQTVYICKGPESKKYHFDPDCRGLSNCSTRIYSVSIDEARSKGRGLCGWED